MTRTKKYLKYFGKNFLKDKIALSITTGIFLAIVGIIIVACLPDKSGSEAAAAHATTEETPLPANTTEGNATETNDTEIIDDETIDADTTVDPTEEVDPDATAPEIEEVNLISLNQLIKNNDVVLA